MGYGKPTEHQSAVTMIDKALEAVPMSDVFSSTKVK